MKTNAENLAAALAAIHGLRRPAMFDGNLEAIAAIRDIAIHATCILDDLTAAPVGHPDIPEAIRAGVDAAHEVARESPSWPVRLDTVQEIRAGQLRRFDKLEVGGGLGIRLEGKRRGFSYDEQTGFAHNLFQELEAIRRDPGKHLHAADIHPELAVPGVLTDEQSKRDWRNLAALLLPLSQGSLKDWEKAGLELCRDDCMGDWSRFPWPDCIEGKAAKDTDGNGTLRTTESAVKGKISDGLKNLIPKN
jgi:hypothetical protein